MPSFLLNISVCTIPACSYEQAEHQIPPPITTGLTFTVTLLLSLGVKTYGLVVMRAILALENVENQQQGSKAVPVQ